MKILLVSLVCLLSSSNIYSQIISKISVRKESCALIKGKKVTEISDCFYSSESLKMVVHGLKPLEYVKKVSSKGEIQIYFLKSKELYLEQNSYLSSKKEELYIYVNNMYDDMGLKAEGFTILDTRNDGNYMIVDWQPPMSFRNKIYKIEIVFENMIPIYSATYNVKGEVYKKTYYSDYLITNSLILPKRVTDITYSSKTDSLVRRVIYSNIKINNQVNDYYLNYKIPENAKLIK